MKAKLLTLLTMFSLMLAPTMAITPVSAVSEASKAVCQGTLDGSSSSASCTDGSSTRTVQRLLKTAIRIFQFIIGVIALFAVLTGGLNYIMSGGDSGKTKSARERIMYAVIGLVIVGVAEIIVQFALNRTFD